MYECVKANVPFVLAGSLRDDGPLPDTITDMNAAQDAYAEQLEGRRAWCSAWARCCTRSPPATCCRAG